MALVSNSDFSSTFGRNLANKNASSKDDRPVAKYWLNIGYMVEYPLEDGTTEARFCSLPAGIALDTMTELKTNSQNETYAAFNAARNNLRIDLLTACEALEPGETKIISGGDSGLSMQLRHVNDEKAVVKPSNNQFVKKLSFAA